MKKCPYCAEDVQDAAVVCKHCKATLPASSPQVVSSIAPSAVTKTREINWKKLGKWFGIIVLVVIALKFWYIGIPAMIAWYLFKKKRNKYSRQKNLIITGSTLALFLIFGIANAHANRAPKLAVTEPQNEATLQAKTVRVRGNVNPSSSKITINSKEVKPDKDGGFSYDQELNNESNIITVVATNGGKSQNQALTIKRTFTPEELAEREQQKAAAEQAQKDAAAKVAQAKADEIKQQLQRELDSFNKPFNNATYRGSKDSLMLELVLFGAWAKMVNEHKNNPDSGVKAMAQELERKVSALQVKEFPLMRKAYGDVVAQGVWESNIDVSVFGPSNKTMELTAGIFANNKNVKDAHAALGDAFTLYRFTRVNYKWYKYDDEYNYYTIDSQPDSAVVEIGK